MDLKNSNNFCKEEWEESYKRRENFCFIPSDEIVKFISRYIVKRVGINEFKKIISYEGFPKVLDACCGIGRNLIFGEQMGLSMYGFDLSSKAVVTAKEFVNSSLNKSLPDYRIKASSVTSIPWPDNFFDHILCESALDSMEYEIAVNGIQEIARVIKPGGLFYSSFISFMTEYETEEGKEVNKKNYFEEGTIQSFFSKEKLSKLIENDFNIVNLELHKIFKNEILINSRWHLICQKK